MINPDKKKHIGIIGAMPEEINSIIKKLKNCRSVRYGDLTIFTGLWYFTVSSYFYITVGWSGWGKVSAARAVTRIISSQLINIPLDLIIFTGVAGSASKKLNQWDVVIADKIYQHDFDARPFFDEFVVPAIKNKYLSPEKIILKNAQRIISRKIDDNKTPFKKLYVGSIATGDEFINSKENIYSLSRKINNLLAVEMEGGAVAQVCHQENIPWLVIRVISDNADEKASEKFEEFLEKYNKNSAILINYLLMELVNQEFI